MCHSRAKCLLVVLLILSGIKISAQTSASSGTNTSNPNNGRENNPYSKYGIGELYDGNNAVLRGMGNVTSAYENPYELNTDNPASLSFMGLTTFEVGATASERYISATGLAYSTGTASISYMTLGFPINKNGGLCLGFKPISRVYYSMADTLPNSTTSSPIGQVARSYNGEGGLNYVYLGAAWQYKGLSIGATGGYMFGTTSNITATVPIDTASINRAYTAEYANYDQIGGLYWKAGAMYEQKLDSDYTFRVGATFALSQNLSDRFSGFQISTYNFGDTVVNDTAGSSGTQHGKLRMPMSWSLGVMLCKSDKWDMGLDFAMTQWSDYHSTVDPTMNAGIASQSYKVSFGGEFTPDANNVRNYFSRITYRYGIYYGKDYLLLSGVQSPANPMQLPIYGITAGGSLPFRRSFSHLHVAVDVGRIGTTANGLIQETYYRFTLGISFNDRWFIRRRYD